MTTAAITRGADWATTLESAIQEAVGSQPQTPTDLAFFFASAEYAPHYTEMLARVQQATGTAVVLGCSGQGIIGPEREIEDEPAMSLMPLSLPGATLRTFHLTQRMLEAAAQDPAYWERETGVKPDEVNAWLLFADPFHLDCEGLLRSFGEAYPNVSMIGGLASGNMRVQETHLFLNEAVYRQGAVAVALGGAYTVKTVVSQGCDPIGEPWIITAANGPVIERISQRPAYEVLVETVRALPPDEQQRASQNLLVGLAIDEYKETFIRGDFLIRNLTGADPDSGALSIAAYPRVGQTIQFQIRDARAAHEDLEHLLGEASESLGSTRPAGALLCSCNGRGQGLFGFPDHDARALAQQLGPVPVAGFFCNGEIGPVGRTNFLHGFTASLALFVPKEKTSN